MARSNAQSRGLDGETFGMGNELQSQGGMSPLRRLQHPPLMARSGGLAPSSPMGMALRKQKMSRQSQSGGQLQLQKSLPGGTDGSPEQTLGGNLRSGGRPHIRQSLQLDDE